MRIVQVVPRAHHPWSGVLTVIVELSVGLAVRGHSVEVWPLHEWDEDPAFGETVQRLQSAGVRCIQTPLPARWWQYGAVAERIVASGGPAVVHLHSAFSPTNTAIARKLEAPYVLSPHGGYAPASLRRSRARKRVYLALAERRLLKRAAVVCALTEAEAEQARAVGRRGPLAIIPNGVSAAPPGTDRTALREMLALRQSERLAVFVGRLDIEHKGLDLLVHGMADLPEWHLALVGPDHVAGRRRLEDEIARLGIAQRVHMLGPRTGPALDEALAGGDVFVLLSRWEGLPVALLEALAHGIPAVVSPAVERTVPVAASGAGWVTASDRLTATLTDLPTAGHPEWRRRSLAARKLAGDYQWGAVVRRYEAAYGEVASRAGSGITA